MQHDFNGANRRIPRASLLPRGRRIAVFPASGDYQVRGVTRDNPYAYAFPSVEGLDKRWPAVFHYCDGGGRRLVPDAPLVLSRTYLVVTHVSHPLPDHQGIVRRALVPAVRGAGSQEWQASLLHLASTDPQLIRNWCRLHFKREVGTPPLSVTIASPPLIGSRPDGTVLLGAHTDVVVVFDGPQACRTPLMMNLRHEPGGTTSWLMLPQQRPPLFIGLGRLEPGLYTLLVPHEKTLSLFMEVSSTEGVDPPTVQFVARRAEPSSRSDTVNLFEIHAGTLLSDARMGRARLESVCLPARLPVTLRWAEPGTSDILERTLTAGGEKSDVFATRVHADLSDLLARPGVPLWFSAEPFGTAAVPPAVRSSDCAALPADLRSRLHWLNSARLRFLEEVGGQGPWQPCAILLAEADLERCAAPDRSLVRRFLDVRTWPVGLLPNVRLASRELTGWLRHRGAYARPGHPGSPR